MRETAGGGVGGRRAEKTEKDAQVSPLNSHRGVGDRVADGQGQQAGKVCTDGVHLHLADGHLGWAGAVGHECFQVKGRVDGVALGGDADQELARAADADAAVTRHPRQVPVRRCFVLDTRKTVPSKWSCEIAVSAFQVSSQPITKLPGTILRSAFILADL